MIVAEVGVAWHYSAEADSPEAALAQVKGDELREPWDDEGFYPVDAPGRQVVRERGTTKVLLSEPAEMHGLRIIVRVNGGTVEVVDVSAGAGHVAVEARDYDVPRDQAPHDWEHDSGGQWPLDSEGRYLRCVPSQGCLGP